MISPALTAIRLRVALATAFCLLLLVFPTGMVGARQMAPVSGDTAGSDHLQDKSCPESDSTQSALTGKKLSATPAEHHHRNISGTGPGPQGELVQRTPAQNERLYQKLKSLYMSPYCPGLTLGSCGSSAAELLRADLREWVFEGHKEKDITSYMIALLGEEVMGRPPFRGSAILVWVAPILAVLFGLWAVMRWIRKNAPGPMPGEVAGMKSSGPSHLDIDPERDARLEAEVRAHYR